ncbi:hypothetical protein [Clostridium botulinum]|nr:hypothetical protein [Clostridium botulinum]
MQNKISTSNIGNKLGDVSLGIPIIVFMFNRSYFSINFKKAFR